MKTINLVCAVALLGACAADANDVATAQTEAAVTSTTFHTNFSGRGADLMYGDGTTGVMLFAFEDGTTHTSNLFVDMQGPDTSSWTCPYSIEPWYCYYTRYSATRFSGTLPAGALAIRVHGPGASAELHALVSAERCVFENGWPLSCEPVSLPVDVSWTANGLYASTFNGTSTRTEGTVTYRDRGSYSASSANVTGSIGALTMSATYGMISDSKGTSVSRDIIRVMQ